VRGEEVKSGCWRRGQGTRSIRDLHFIGNSPGGSEGQRKKLKENPYQ